MKYVHSVVSRQGRNNGFTLIELVIVLAIMAIMIASAAKGYEWIRGSKITATAEQVRSIRQGALAWRYMTGQTTYAGLTNTVLTNSGYIRITDSTNPFGGTNTAAPQGATGDQAKTLQVVVATMPNDQTGANLTTLLQSYFPEAMVAYASSSVTITWADTY